MAGGARCVGGDEIASAVSCRKVVIAVRAVVLSEVFVIIVACLKGEDKGVCAGRVSGEGVEGVRYMWGRKGAKGVPRRISAF